MTLQRKTQLKKTGLPSATEHQIQTAIIQYLGANKWYVMRLNSGKMPYTYKGVQRYMQLLAKGTPDLVAFKRIETGKNYDLEYGTRLVFIEVKRPGKEPETAQVLKMNELEEYGAECIVAHSVQEVMDAGL